MHLSMRFLSIAGGIDVSPGSCGRDLLPTLRITFYENILKSLLLTESVLSVTSNSDGILRE